MSRVRAGPIWIGIAVIGNSLILALFLPFPVVLLVQIVYFSPSPVRDCFFITTIICESPQSFLAQIKLLSSLQQPSRIPRALPHTPPGKCFVLPEFFGPSHPERSKPQKLMA